MVVRLSYLTGEVKSLSNLSMTIQGKVGATRGFVCRRRNTGAKILRGRHDKQTDILGNSLERNLEGNLVKCLANNPHGRVTVPQNGKF